MEENFTAEAQRARRKDWSVLFVYKGEGNVVNSIFKFTGNFIRTVVNNLQHVLILQ